LRSRRQRKDGGKVSASSDRFAGRSGITNPSSHAPSFSFNRITVATTRLRLKTVLSLESVVIEDEGHELEVNVSLSTPCGYKAGSRYQFIGELDRRRNGSGHGVETSPVLVARISRNVNGLDLDLYRRGIEAQNECLRETPPP